MCHGRGWSYWCALRMGPPTQGNPQPRCGMEMLMVTLILLRCSGGGMVRVVTPVDLFQGSPDICLWIVWAQQLWAPSKHALCFSREEV